MSRFTVHSYNRTKIARNCTTTSRTFDLLFRITTGKMSSHVARVVEKCHFSNRYTYCVVAPSNLGSFPETSAPPGYLRAYQTLLLSSHPIRSPPPMHHHAAKGPPCETEQRLAKFRRIQRHSQAVEVGVNPLLFAGAESVAIWVAGSSDTWSR